MGESEKLYLETLKGLEQTQYVVVLAASLAKRLTSINKANLLDDYLESLLETFIKKFVSCKTRPLPNVIIASYPLLKQVNHDLFKKNLWPSLQKAMLRNPEIILECVGLVISGLNLDLSVYATEVGNSLIGTTFDNSSSQFSLCRFQQICIRKTIKREMTRPTLVNVSRNKFEMLMLSKIC